jgi:hypothetical protein
MLSNCFRVRVPTNLRIPIEITWNKYCYEKIDITPEAASTWPRRASADFAGATPEQSAVRTALSKPTVLKKLPSCK